MTEALQLALRFAFNHEAESARSQHSTPESAKSLVRALVLCGEFRGVI
jgi:hypothetical protein